MGPIIWYLEPRCASMGKRSALVPVADVSKAVHDRRFSQQQIITQLQNFRDKVTMMNHQLTDLQHSLADLAILSARQEQFQQTCLEELRSLKTQTTTLPQPTWSTSPPQPITTFHPSRTPFAAGTSSPSPTTPPFHSSSHPVCHFPTSRYLPQSSSGSVFHPFDYDPHSFHHYPPPSPTHDPHFTHAYSTPPHSPMTIPAPDLPGPTTSTLAVLEFTTALLEPTLHPVSLDKQVQRVTESVSSLRVCHDRLQTQPTEGADGLESQLEGLDSTLGLNPSRALESTPSNPYPRPLIYSTPLTSIPHLESVTKAPCSLSTVLIPSILPGIGSSPTVSLQTTPHLPSQIPSSTPPQLRHHRVPPLPSTSPLLTAMAPPSRTRASVTVEGSRTTNRSGHTYKHLTRFLTSIPSVAMKRKPKSGVLSYRQSKNSFNFSSSSVGSSLRPYFRTDGIVHTVLIHDVTSRLKGRSQSSCTDSRVVQLLGKPTAAMAKLSPKADVLQIAHPIHPPKEPNKVRLRQSEIYEDKDNLRKVVLPALGGPTVPGTTVFSAFYGRLKEIHESHRKHPVARVVDANEENEILFKEDPQIEFSEEEAFGRYLDLHEIYNQYINSKFGEPIEYSAYLANISQPQQLPRTLKSSRQYRACMETLLAYLIYFFQRTEPLQHLDRIFLKVETEFEESWADGNVKGWENEKQETGHVQDQLTMINLDYYSTVEELMEVGPEKLKVALASLGLKTGGTVPHAVETILGYLITLLIGTFAALRLCSMDIFLKLIGKASKWEFTGRGSMIGSTIWHNNLVLLTNVCLLVFRGNTCVTRSLIRLSEQSATLTWPTEGHFGQEAGVFTAFIRGHIPDPLQIMAESLFLIFQELISMVLSLAVGPEQIGCSSFSPNLAAIENFYWMLILPKLQSPHATEHPTLMDNALKFFIAIWNTTLETMILQFSLTLPPFLSAESPVVHSFAINDLDQSHQSKHNILLEQFGARKASLGLAYFNFHDNGITALLPFNPAISFLSSYFPHVHRGHILLWRLSASYKPYMLWMFQAAMSSTGTWCFELIIKVVRSVGVQLDHIIYNHAILGLGTAKSLEQNCTVMYGVWSHFGNLHDIKTWAMLFADHSFMVKDLSRLAKLLQYCVDDAHLSDASLLNPRMQDYYSINTKVVDTYLQNVSRYKLKIILGLCSVALHASGSLRPKFFGYITFLDFWKLVCLWNASRFGNLAYSPRVYAGTYSATEVQFARIELVLQCFLLYPLPAMIFGLSTFVTPQARLNTILRDVCFIAPALLQRSCMVEAQLGRLGSKFCLEANVFVVCLAIHTALVLEASIMIHFWNPKALGEQATQASTCQLDGMRTCLILRGREC